MASSVADAAPHRQPQQPAAPPTPHTPLTNGSVNSRGSQDRTLSSGGSSARQPSDTVPQSFIAGFGAIGNQDWSDLAELLNAYDVRTIRNLKGQLKAQSKRRAKRQDDLTKRVEYYQKKSDKLEHTVRAANAASGGGGGDGSGSTGNSDEMRAILEAKDSELEALAKKYRKQGRSLDDMKRYCEELRMNQSQLGTTSSENTQLKNRCLAAESTVNNLQEDLDLATVEVNQHKKAAAKYQRMAMDARTELRNSNDRSSSRPPDPEPVRESKEYKELKERFERISQSAAKMDAQLSSYRRKNQDLEKMLKTEERNAKDNKGAAMELHIAKKLFEKKMDAAKERERALQDRMHDVQDGNTGELDKVRDTLEKEIGTLKSDNSLLKYDKNALTSKLRLLEKEAKDAKLNTSAVESEANTEVDNLRKTHAEDASKARSEIDRLHRDINGLSQEHEQHKRKTHNQMDRMYDQHQQVKRDLEHARQQKEQHQNQIKQMLEQLTMLQQQNQQMGEMQMKAATDLHGQLDQMGLKNKDFEETVEGLNGELEELRGELATKEVELETAQEELRETQEALEEAEEQLAQKEEEEDEEDSDDDDDQQDDDGDENGDTEKTADDEAKKEAGESVKTEAGETNEGEEKKKPAAKKKIVIKKKVVKTAAKISAAANKPGVVTKIVNGKKVVVRRATVKKAVVKKAPVKIVKKIGKTSISKTPAPVRRKAKRAMSELGDSDYDDDSDAMDWGDVDDESPSKKARGAPGRGGMRGGMGIRGGRGGKVAGFTYLSQADMGGKISKPKGGKGAALFKDGALSGLSSFAALVGQAAPAGKPEDDIQADQPQYKWNKRFDGAGGGKGGGKFDKGGGGKFDRGGGGKFDKGGRGGKGDRGDRFGKRGARGGGSGRDPPVKKGKGSKQGGSSMFDSGAFDSFPAFGALTNAGDGGPTPNNSQSDRSGGGRNSRFDRGGHSGGRGGRGGGRGGGFGGSPAGGGGFGGPPGGGLPPGMFGAPPASGSNVNPLLTNSTKPDGGASRPNSGGTTKPGTGTAWGNLSSNWSKEDKSEEQRREARNKRFDGNGGGGGAPSLNTFKWGAGAPGGKPPSSSAGGRHASGDNSESSRSSRDRR